MKGKLQIQASEYKKLADEELVHRYVHLGENIAINYLYERYAHLVFGVCLKYVKNTDAAKDLTQQIFIKLLDDLKKYHIDRFKPWLYKVSKNACLMQLRGTIKVAHNTVDVGEDMEFTDNKHLVIEREEELEKLEQAVAQLNEEQRVCVELFYLQKLSYSEITFKTGYSLLQVKSFIQNGKRNLKIVMEAFQYERR